MSFATKTDYIGLATTGLEVVTNNDGATNQNLEIPQSNGSIVTNEKFGSVKAPTVDYEITAAIAAFKKELGKVYKQNSAIALKGFNVHTGAGEKPTFSATGVQIEASATQTICTYETSEIALSPARHASTFGAIGDVTESATLTLQSGDYAADAEIDPTTINGVPKASDAVKAKETVTLTFWTNSDTTEPTITPSANWQITSDFACVGQDGGMFVWTVTLTKYLSVKNTVTT